MDKSHLTVTKHNKVIQASYRLTLSEQRVLLACISQIDSMAKLSADDKFEITVSEIADLASLKDTKTAYRDLKNAADRLFERRIIIDDPKPNDSEESRLKTRWISGIRYFDKAGKIKLSFAPDILPYLSELSREFTKYKLQHVAGFKSSYSIRLYELLCQWQSSGEREVSIDWLKAQFQISDKYKSIRDLKSRVIVPALADINKHSNLWCKYGQRKTGRRVTHFQFQFGLKKTKQPNQDNKRNGAFLGSDSKARPGESDAEYKLRIMRKATKGQTAARLRKG
jgi:plasmid replication initiation protein